MSKAFASIAEEFVARYLIGCGYQIVARNARHIGFELDIVAWRKPDLVIVEVKLRQRKVAENAGAGTQILDASLGLIGK